MLGLAVLAFFILTGCKDFGLTFKYMDLLRGVACVLIAISLVLGNNLGM